MQAVSSYKCPHCGKKYESLKTWGNHVSGVHPGLIPEGWSYSRYFYFILTGKKTGHCVECKNPTDWNEGSQKYERFCKDPKCKEAYKKRFQARMISRHGKVHLLDDPMQQRKMLAAKKISGTYTFKNGMKVPYTGTYELDFVRMLDTFLAFDPNDLMMPSPHTYSYEYHNPDDKEHEGTHFYIPDAYIPSLNLEVEIKQNTNKHPKILRIDKVKEAQKDAMMATIPGVNYIKIVDKDYSGFFEFIQNYQPEERPTIAKALEAFEATMKNDTIAYTQELNNFLEPLRELLKGDTDPSTIATESAGYSKERRCPVFIILTMGASPLAKMITMTVKDNVSHSSIAFNTDLDPLYSFGINQINGNGRYKLGFIKTNPHSDLWSLKGEKVPYEIYVTYVSKDELAKMKRRVEDFASNAEKMRYSLAGCVRNFAHIKSAHKRKWFCSSFVAEILYAGGVPMERDTTLYRPMELSLLPNVELVTVGENITDFDVDDLKRELRKIKKKENRLELSLESSVKFAEYDMYYKPPKEKTKLSGFKSGKLDLPMLKAFRSEVPNLKHVRYDRTANGEIFTDGKKVVGYYQTTRQDNCVWLQAFEILEEYRGQGLSSQMLERAIRKTGLTNLSVDVRNNVAIRLYLQHGFQEYSRTPKVIYMNRVPDTI